MVNLGRTPRIPVAMNSSSPRDGNDWSGRLFVLASILGAPHSLGDGALYVLARCGQLYSFPGLSYIRLCPGYLTMGGWCARYKSFARNDSETSVWVASSAVDFWTRISRVLIGNSVLGCSTWSVAVRQYSSSVCSSSSFFSLRGASIGRVSRAYSGPFSLSSVLIRWTVSSIFSCLV